MKARTFLIVVLFAWPHNAAGDQPPPQPAQPVEFTSQILPLLQTKCWDCHGPETQESHLRLDRREAALQGGNSGEPALVPGKANLSHLIQLVRGEDPQRRMPPDKSDRLTAAEIQLLTEWIDQGADWPSNRSAQEQRREPVNHWSFQPPQSPIPPAINDPWVVNEIDRFVLQGLRARSLEPNPPASRAELARRLSLDILGLPSSPESIQSFQSDSNPRATQLLIERLLASPHFGERQASYWLDLVRFAETNGYETNRERPQAWPYRDFVIRSFNEDKPYDRFVKEQLAGDAMGAPEATAFLVAGPYDLVKSPDINLTRMQRQNELDDMIATTGTAFLGLTIGCARCHNHKFDPIRQTDYYAWQAIFAGVQHGDRTISLTKEAEQEIARLVERQASLREALRPFLKRPLASRPSVNARDNEERFASVPARFIRFTVLATNSSEPCLDEIEIFSDSTNVALASVGAKATCSSALPGHAIHRIEHVHDGRFGNSYSWISNEQGRGWIQIELAKTAPIQRIRWSRDREGLYSDRIATEYRIEAAVEPNQWFTVASSADRVPWSNGGRTEPEYDFAAAPPSEVKQGRDALDEFRRIEQRKLALQASTTVYAGTFQPPGPTHRLFRGDPAAQREIVSPDTLSALGKLSLAGDSTEQTRRAALAEWIAAPNNPLTARVIVNRIWQQHFGTGIVATASDFGAAGARPTHPELLDWLATQLVDHGWSLKHVHRLILNSATYQQSSKPRPKALSADGLATWLWRFPPRRLDAEPIRDSILSVAGTLDLRQFGPGFSAFEVQNENVRHYFPKQAFGPEDWRRMIYMTKVRLEREAVFGVLDCPDGAISVPRRSRSTTPLQALNLFNSPFMIQQSELFADRLRRECGTGSDEQVQRAYWLAYGRAPSPDERAAACEFIRSETLAAFCRALLNSNEFVFLQ